MGRRRKPVPEVIPAKHITAEVLEVLSPLIRALARLAAKQLAEEEAAKRGSAANGESADQLGAGGAEPPLS